VSEPPLTTLPAGAPEHDAAGGACEGAESFALQVIGQSMAPEFAEGEVIIVEPGGLLRDGCYVLARHDDGFILRQLCRRGEGWSLHALNPAFADIALDDGLAAVRGVVIQKAVPGRRRAGKRYV
jgi:DNA polymerase V